MAVAFGADMLFRDVCLRQGVASFVHAAHLQTTSLIFCKDYGIGQKKVRLIFAGERNDPNGRRRANVGTLVLQEELTSCSPSQQRTRSSITRHATHFQPMQSKQKAQEKFQHHREIFSTFLSFP